MKLPQINYGGRVGVNQTIGPQAAVRTAQQRQGVANAVYQLGEQVAEQKIEYDTNKANSAYADEISKFNRDMATRVDFTPDEIRGMGLEESVEITNRETGEDLASIPKYKVYAVAMEQRMQEAKERHGAGIASTKFRQAWGNVVDSENRQALDKAVADSANMAQDYEMQAMLVDIETAWQSGDYITARDLLTDNPRLLAMMTPAQIDTVKDEITTAEIETGFRNDMEAFTNSNSSEAARQEATRLRSDDVGKEYATLNDKELNAWADQFDRLAKGIDDGNKINITRQEKQARAQGLNSLYQAADNGTLDINDVYKFSGAEWADSSFVKSANSIWKNYKDSDGESPYPAHRDLETYNNMRSSILDTRKPTTAVMAEYEDGAGKFTKVDSDDFYQQISERDDPETIQNVLKPQASLTTQLLTYGKNKTDNPQLVALASGELNRRISTAAAGGHPLTPEQTTKAVDDVAIMFGANNPVEIDRPWSWTDAEGSNIFEAIQAEDPEAWPDIRAILSGREVTPAAVDREYRLWLKRNK